MTKIETYLRIYEVLSILEHEGIEGEPIDSLNGLLSDIYDTMSEDEQNTTIIESERI